MQNELISIIIPVYNVENYLDQCIESIIGQTYHNLQIIIVDDGSPDSCPMICEKWADIDNRIEVIHKSNGGLSDARNAGMKIARGKYIGFVDSDDFIEKEMFEQLVKALNKYDADIACCGRYIYDEKKQKCEKKYVLKNELVYTSNEFMKEILIGKSIDEAVWDKLYKRSLFKNIEFPIGEINEDIVTIPKLILRTKKVVHTGKPLYYYRVVASSISKSLYTEKNRVLLNHIYLVESYVRKHFVNIEKEISIFKSRYAYSAIFKLSMDKKSIQKYRSDYKNYLNILRKEFLSTFFLKDIEIKEKLFSFLMLVGCFGKIREIKYLVYKEN